jgi:hypothetical protein
LNDSWHYQKRVDEEKSLDEAHQHRGAKARVDQNGPPACAPPATIPETIVPPITARAFGEPDVNPRVKRISQSAQK